MTQFDKMLSFIESAWPARSFIVPCLIGPPGIGKTAAVREFARRLSEQDGQDHKVVVINAQRCIPSEVISMTMPDEANKTMVLYNSDTLTSLKPGDLLFLDELWEAHPNVLSVLLTMIESRIMADGTPLPDIMIVAATNATVPAGQLPLNIRQRFVSMEFSIDRNGTYEYIKDTYGVKISDELTDMIASKGDTYNVLTPRSLTKMVHWMVETPVDQRSKVADQINCIWKNSLGSKILKDVNNSAKKTKEQQTREAIIDIFDGCTVALGPDSKDVISFESDSLERIFEWLQNHYKWDDIKKKLMELELEDTEEVDVDVKF